MRESAFVRQQRTLCHAEPVLLVCDDQSQLPELHLFLENGVGSHQHFQCSVFQLLIERPFLFGTDGTGEQSDGNAQRCQKLLEGVLMLRRQNFRGCHQCALQVVLNGEVAGRCCHGCFTAAHIALQQTVHGRDAAEVAGDLGDRLLLSLRHLKREGVVERRHVHRVHCIGGAGAVALTADEHAQLKLKQFIERKTAACLFHGGLVLRKVNLLQRHG